MSKKDSASVVRKKLAALRADTGWTNSELKDLLKPKSAGGIKGGDYERLFAVELGKWWADREDVFWRTGGSGGRASRRHEKGRETAQQHGDIAAIDPDGAPLTEFLTFELKCGYNEEHLTNVLDRNQTAKRREFEAFVTQANAAHEAAWSYAWIIFHKRDRKPPFCYMPTYLWQALEEVCNVPDYVLTVEVTGRLDIVGVWADDFFRNVQRHHIEKLYEAWKNGRL